MFRSYRDPKSLPRLSNMFSPSYARRVTTSRARTAVIAAELILAALTAGVGAFAAGATFQQSGAGSGAAWMAAFAVVGVIGLVVVGRGLQTANRRLAVAGLLLTALSPTVFAYPLNLILLLIAGAEAVYGGRRRTRAAA